MIAAGYSVWTRYLFTADDCPNVLSMRFSSRCGIFLNTNSQHKTFIIFKLKWYCKFPRSMRSTFAVGIYFRRLLLYTDPAVLQRCPQATSFACCWSIILTSIPKSLVHVKIGIPAPCCACYGSFRASGRHRPARHTDYTNGQALRRRLMPGWGPEVRPARSNGPLSNSRTMYISCQI